jgi:prepilin-type N-terminal cleavage/methylation domain-containing protein
MRRGTEAGFTLLELLMAMTISTAIMGSIVVVSGQLQRSYYRQIEGASVQQEARFALDWIVRELNTAGNNPMSVGTGTCPSAGTVFRSIRRDPNADNVQNDIRVHSDLNGNGLLGGLTVSTCTEAGEDITIQLNTATNTIQRRDNNTELAAVDKSDSVITGLTFAYLDSNRATAASDSAVSFIQITVTAQTPTVNADTGQPQTFTETAEVRVRSR